MEMMVIAAAREIKNGEIVCTGTYLPILPVFLAKRTHAPDITVVFEAGIFYDLLPSRIPLVATDPCLVSLASLCGDCIDSLGMVLHGGYADVGLLSANSVDKYGNINTTCVGDYAQPRVRLAGSGGACDFGCLSKRLIVLLEHSRERFPERVDFITTPGYLSGGDSRARAGLRAGGPGVVVTTLGVFRFAEDTREMYLESYHPGVTIQQIRDNVQWELKVSPEVRETEPPTETELRILREEVDPQGMYLRDARVRSSL
jgi:glutaconate CoA-transferase subunit B